MERLTLRVVLSVEEGVNLVIAINEEELFAWGEAVFQKGDSLVIVVRGVGRWSGTFVPLGAEVSQAGVGFVAAMNVSVQCTIMKRSDGSAAVYATLHVASFIRGHDVANLDALSTMIFCGVSQCLSPHVRYQFLLLLHLHRWAKS